MACKIREGLLYRDIVIVDDSRVAGLSPVDRTPNLTVYDRALEVLALKHTSLNPLGSSSLTLISGVVNDTPTPRITYFKLVEIVRKVHVIFNPARAIRTIRRDHKY